MYNNATEQLPPRNVSLTTFLQSWKYFVQVEDQLRVDLTFKNDSIHVTEARAFINASTPANWSNLDFVRVVIHVRRGDYASLAHIRDGWPVAGRVYFNRSMRYFTDCFERVQFIVISDDIRWCKRNIVGPNVVYSTGRSQITDLAIASLCDHAVVSIGSFGLWAAWFAGGVTVTQAGLPRPGSSLSRRVHREDYYRPDFVGLR